MDLALEQKALQKSKYHNAGFFFVRNPVEATQVKSRGNEFWPFGNEFRHFGNEFLAFGNEFLRLGNEF